VFRRGTYSPRAAARDLERLSPRERADAEAWYRLTEERARALGAPSNLGWLVALRFIVFGLDVGPESPRARACVVAINMGYAARIADIERRSDLSRWSEADISELVAGDECGRIELDAIKDQGPRTENLVRWLQARFDDPDVFLTIASCMPSLWDGLTSWAVMNIHANARKHSARPRDLAPSTLGGLMRLGYVLRCLDEALGEEPGDPSSYAV
jgi:hypothetical protein